MDQLQIQKQLFSVWNQLVGLRVKKAEDYGVWVHIHREKESKEMINTGAGRKAASALLRGRVSSIAGAKMRTFGTAKMAMDHSQRGDVPQVQNPSRLAGLKPSERIVARVYTDMPAAPTSFYVKAFVVAFTVGFGLELMMCKSGFYEHEVKKMIVQHEEDMEIERLLDVELEKMNKEKQAAK